MSDEQYLESRGWYRRDETNWWRDPYHAPHADWSPTAATRIQMWRDLMIAVITFVLSGMSLRLEDCSR